MFSAAKVSSRWFESFSIPGYSAYEANQRTLKAFGSGQQSPLVAVVTVPGDVTKTPGVDRALEAAIAANPGARSSSYFSTGSRAYVSKDGHTTFAEIFQTGTPGFGTETGEVPTYAALSKAAPQGATVHVTGDFPIIAAADKGASAGPSILGETLIGGVGAL